MSAMTATPVKIVEVGPRDGLQNEPPPYFTLEEKLHLIRCLIEAGMAHIEVASFVSPKRVPQMAGSADLVAQLPTASHVSFRALVPNQRGLDQALASGVSEIAIFTAASDAFCENNIGCTAEQSLARYQPIIEQASAAGVRVRGYISTITHCPFTGNTSKDKVKALSLALLKMGCYEIALGDTTGQTRPEQLNALLSFLCQDIAATQLSGHFHDTYHNALNNVKEAMTFGLTTFDSSISGLGGCPYAPGAQGNLATEKLALFLAEEGRLAPSISLEGLTQTSNWLQKTIDAKKR